MGCRIGEIRLLGDHCQKVATLGDSLRRCHGVTMATSSSVTTARILGKPLPVDILDEQMMDYHSHSEARQQQLLPWTTNPKQPLLPWNPRQQLLLPLYPSHSNHCCHEIPLSQEKVRGTLM